MSPPSERAFWVLSAARELLVQRLSEAILESEQEFLADANGDTYVGAIDSIFERFGTKLTQVHQLTTILASTLGAEEETEPNPDAVQNGVSDQPLAQFIQFVKNGQNLKATKHLGEWLGLTSQRAEECVELFQRRLTTEPGFLDTALQLRSEVALGEVNTALALLWECFGLQGIESLQALRWWQQIQLPSR